MLEQLLLARRIQRNWSVWGSGRGRGLWGTRRCRRSGLRSSGRGRGLRRSRRVVVDVGKSMMK
jgi:hypothetical protein